MNYITKRNRLQTQLDLYINFLPIAPPESKFELMEEMLKIRNEINRIHAMTLKQLHEQIIIYYQTKKSKM